MNGRFAPEAAARETCRMPHRVAPELRKSVRASASKPTLPTGKRHNGPIDSSRLLQQNPPKADLGVIRAGRYRREIAKARLLSQSTMASIRRTRLGGGSLREIARRRVLVQFSNKP